MVNNKKSRITRRFASTKRHTNAFLIDGKRMTPKQASVLARQGKLANVVAVADHIQSAPGRGIKLYDLPVTIERD